MKIAILLYLYHTDVWEDVVPLLEQFKNNYNTKLYLSIYKDAYCEHIIQDCNILFKDSSVIKLVENKGLDLWPFCEQIQNLDATDTPIFIKIHSKKSIIQGNDIMFDWSEALLHSVIGDISSIAKNLKIFSTDEKVGAVCLDNFIMSNSEGFHTKTIKSLCKLLKIPYSKVGNSNVMLGGVFFGKTEVFKKILNKNTIDKLSSLIEQNVTTLPTSSTYTHALECVISYYISHLKFKINACIVNTLKIFNKDLNKVLNLVITHTDTCYIKENPLINGVIVERDDDNIFIIWNNAVDTDIQHYIKNKDLKAYCRVCIKRESTNSFCPVAYKSLNKDLLHLTNEEAITHYNTYGLNDGRVFNLKAIEDVFDINYYKNKYNLKNNKNCITDYIEKGRYQHRLYNPIILEKTFDYGFYISFHQHLNLKNQYQALKHFLETRNKCNNILNCSNNLPKNKDITCIYVANIQDKKDVYFALNDLEILEKNCKKIIIVSNIKFTDKVNVILNGIKCNRWYVDGALCGLKKINPKNNNNILFTTNQTFIVRDVKDFITFFNTSNTDLLSLTDSYTQSPTDNKHTYHIHLDCVLFKRELLNKLIVNLESFKTQNYNSSLFLYSFDLTKYLIQENKQIGALLTPSHEIELLWGELLYVEINKRPDLLYKHNIPIIHRDNIFYFNQLKIDQYNGNSLTRFKPRMWIDTTTKVTHNESKVCCIIHIYTLDNIDYFNTYISDIATKLKNVVFYITGKKQAFDKLYKNNIQMFFLKTKYENRGMDIGPFLQCLSYFKKENIQYDFIIKLHEKRTTHWREYLFDNIKTNLYKFIQLLSHKDVSIVGSYAYLHALDVVNRDLIEQICIRYDIPFNYDKELDYNGFFAGTMFICKHSVFNDFIDTYNVNLDYEYEYLEQGAVDNEYATYTHAWERILSCIIPTIQKTKLKCI